jgi:hypothetical protein
MPARIRVGNARQWVTVHRSKFGVNQTTKALTTDTQSHRENKNQKAASCQILVPLWLCVSVVKAFVRFTGS